MDLNNRRTGKGASKPRKLGLLGHSDYEVARQGIGFNREGVDSL